MQSGSVRRVNWREESDEALGQRASGGRDGRAARKRRVGAGSSSAVRRDEGIESEARRDETMRFGVEKGRLILYRNRESVGRRQIENNLQVFRLARGVTVEPQQQQQQ